MPILLRFSSSSGTAGMEALAFMRSPHGLGLFYDVKEQGVISSNEIAFHSVSPPGDFAFRLDSPNGTRWRSGPQNLSSQTTDIFQILDAGNLTFTADEVAEWRPATPITVKDITVDTVEVSLGAGRLTATGDARYATIFGSAPVTYEYVFTLEPEREPANMGFPDGVPPVLKVRTLGMRVTGANRRPLGFLVNPVITALAGLMSASITAEMQRRVSSAITAKVAEQLASRNAPDGTIPTVETLSIAPSGITLATFAGFSLDKACPTAVSVDIRPRNQLVHLRLIRDRLLTSSPEGVTYIKLFEKFSPELVRMLLGDGELLQLADSIVRRVTEEFPREDVGAGRLSDETARLVLAAMERVERAGSPDLALTVRALREEVGRFVGKPARAVLDESFQLIRD